MYDPHEWRVKRSASLVADLAAQATTAMPTLQAINAAQTAELTGKTEKGPGRGQKDGANDGGRPEDHRQVRRR